MGQPPTCADVHNKAVPVGFIHAVLYISLDKAAIYPFTSVFIE